MSIRALSGYTVYAKYAKYLNEERRREAWKEQVSRVFAMHRIKYAKEIAANPALAKLIDETEQAVLKKLILGSQRALQFGGEPIERRNDKIYNCAVTYVDRPEAFQHIMYMLLCGCGVGFSVQKHHVEKLPQIQAPRYADEVTFKIPDSIEGWADAIGVLVNSYFVNSGFWSEYEGRNVKFDYSQIRPKGSLISGGFKAPGPDGLKASIEKIRGLIESRLRNGETTLHAIDYYDIIMHASDAVLSGGVRRSATICLFSRDDDEMLTAKTGNWYYKNPQRGRSNNSVVLVRNEVTEAEFAEIMHSVKEFGEPGFIWTDDADTLYNPCVEIGMLPQTADGRSGVQYCNLTEINGKKCTDRDTFFEACKYASILGTLQAGYTDFEYLGATTEEIVRNESLLGVSITGMMDNPEILFNETNQRNGAGTVKEWNAAVAEMIGINPAARSTCVKPAGCLVPETPIKTTNGDMTLADLFKHNGTIMSMADSDSWHEWKDRDLKIINEHGEPETITKLYVNGYDEVIDLTLENGETVTCTHRHRFKVGGKWLRADELVEGCDIEEVTCVKHENDK